MVMPPRRSSSGMQSIRRELQRRRPKPLAPKTLAAKKSSLPPLPLPPAVPRSTPLSRSAVSSARSTCQATPTAAALLCPGTPVGVRTRTATLKTGDVLVLWLRATVVSTTHEGYDVVYDGNWPPGDPHGTVRVPRRHVRMMDPSPTTPSPPSQKPTSFAPSPCASTATVASVKKKEMKPAPRPTRAGKSLRLIRSLLPEMERLARSDFQEY